MQMSKEAAEARKKLVKEVANPDLSFSDEMRAWQDEVRNQKLPAGVVHQYRWIADINCLEIVPKGANASGAILYLHGGGLVVGGPDTHALLCSHLSLTTGMRVIVPDYRLLPDHGFPAPLDDCLAVYNGLINEGILPGTIALGGDSHGAALAVSLLAVLRDMQASLPCAAFSISGAFDSTLSDPDLPRLDLKDPLLSLYALRLWQRRVERIVQLHDPLLSPVFGNLSALTPILLLAGSDEIWRNDTLRFTRKWEDAGGTAQAQIFDGMWHVWPMLPDLPESKTANEMIARFLCEHIQRPHARPRSQRSSP